MPAICRGGKKLSVLVVVHKPSVVQRGGGSPVGVVIQNAPRTDLEQGGNMTVATEEAARVPVRKEVETVFPNSAPQFNQCSNQVGVAVGAAQVAGVEVVLAHYFLRALPELPVEDTRAESTRNWLWLPRAFVITEAVVGQAHSLRQQPTFAAVLVQEMPYSSVPVTCPVDTSLKIAKSHLGEDRVSKFRILFFIDPPELSRVSVRFYKITTPQNV